MKFSPRFVFGEDRLWERGSLPGTFFLIKGNVLQLWHERLCNQNVKHVKNFLKFWGNLQTVFNNTWVYKEITSSSHFNNQFRVGTLEQCMHWWGFKRLVCIIRRNQQEHKLSSVSSTREKMTWRGDRQDSFKVTIDRILNYATEFFKR